MKTIDLNEKQKDVLQKTKQEKRKERKKRKEKNVCMSGILGVAEL